VRPNFTRAQVADLDTFESHIQQLISKIPRDGSTVDLQTLFFQLTLDSATEFLFGESVNSLSSTEGSEQHRFGAAFDLAQSRLGNRSRMGKLVHLYRDSEFVQACQIVHDFVDKIIYRALDIVQPHDAEKSISGKGDADRYVFLTEIVKATRDPLQLRDELLNILLAGRDTTASLLSNTFHVLARRPDIWKKLKTEVDELGGEKPNYETLRNMKYLKYVLNECKISSLSRTDITELSSTPPLPRRPWQRSLCETCYNNSSRRRPRRPITRIHPQGRHCSLQRLHDAPTQRHLWPRRR
jgi:cytochrome P450